MPINAQIDVKASEKPALAEKSTVQLQENGEMLGPLDNGRTFRFKTPTDTERNFQLENKNFLSSTVLISVKWTARKRGLSAC